MAQKEKYTEEQLMDAVVKYSETVSGKIKITELAKWAADNVPGLEGIQAHNFRGKRKVINKRTGKQEQVQLQAFERIQSINEMRMGTEAMRSTELLHSSDPDKFLYLPRPIQRRQILDAREFIEKLIDKDRALTKQNNVLMEENIRLKDDNIKLQDRFDQIQERQGMIEKKLSQMIRVMDEQMQAETLQSLGVMNDGVDLEAHVKSLRQDTEDVFSISKSIRRFKKGDAREDGPGQAADIKKQNMINGLMQRRKK